MVYANHRKMPPNRGRSRFYAAQRGETILAPSSRFGQTETGRATRFAVDVPPSDRGNPECAPFDITGLAAAETTTDPTQRLADTSRRVL